MAGSYDVVYVTVPVGTLNGTGVLPLFKNLTDNGSITILSANLTPCGSATGGTGIWRLVYVPGSVGTAGYGAADGTLCVFGSAANIGTPFRPLAGTIATYNGTLNAVVPENKWVALEFAGTSGGFNMVQVAYIKGISGT